MRPLTGAGTLTTRKDGLRSGTLVELLPGVTIPAQCRDDPVWLGAAVCARHPAAVLMMGVAARATFWPEIQVEAVDVGGTRPRTPRCDERLRFHQHQIPASQCATWYAHTAAGPVRVRTTRPARTALDLAAVTDGGSLDEVLRRREASPLQLERTLATMAGVPGIGAVRELMRHVRANAWSHAERRLHRMLNAARVGRWEANAPITVGEKTCYGDIVFRGLVVEVDGWAYHHRHDSFEHDRIRQNALVLAGWTVLRFTPARIQSEPAQVLEEIRAGVALGRKRHLLHLRRGADPLRPDMR